MQKIFEQYKNNGELHHFHLIEGEKENVKKSLMNFLEKDFGINPHDSSLFYNYEFDQFLVDDSRALSMKAQIKTPEGEKMVFVVFANSINHQAQNALLKMMEEPTERTYFFVVLPRTDSLLPTFISRSVLVRGERRQSGETLNDLRKKTVGERLKFVDGLVKDIKDEKIEKIEAQKFIRNLINDLKSEIEKKSENDNTSKGTLQNKPKKTDIIKTLIQIDDYLKDSGSSTKILLERAVLLI